MNENETLNLMDYAVVEDGVIVNVLVFDNEKTAEEFGCLPLAPYQGIGDKYISPEEYKEQQFKQEIQNAVDAV